jgi:hypothetical protein
MEEKKAEEVEDQVKGKKKKVDDKLPYCTAAPSAEQARSDEDDEPCDDGRGGDIG